MNKKAHIQRLLVFYLCAEIKDPDKVMDMIAAEAQATREEVWDVYTEMMKEAMEV